jgi:peptidase M50B-like protein
MSTLHDRGKLRGVLPDIIHRLFAVQPGPPRPVIVGAAMLAFAVVAVPTSWRWSRHVITIAHEGGHAAVALLSGRRLQGIKLHSDTSGLTVSAGRPTGLGMIMTLLAGYPAAPVVGLIGALLLTSGRVTLMLGVALLLLPLMLVMIRNVFGVLSIVAVWGAIFAVAWFASTAVQAAFAYTTVWFLLIGGVRPVFELHRQRRRGRMPYSDADQIGRLTYVPALAWVGVFLALAVLALVAGAWLLARWLLPN